MNADKVSHNCGLAVAHTLHDVYSYIKSLQHRGRDATGIAGIGENRIDVVKWVGPVDRFDVTDLHKIFPRQFYHTFFAHVRYATRGRKDQLLQDAHPQVIGGTVHNNGTHVIIKDCSAVLIHNGQVNDKFLISVDKTQLNSDCDSEALLHLAGNIGEEALLHSVPGAYALAYASRDLPYVLVLRDKSGIKPAVLGLKDGRYDIASEDIAFRRNGTRVVENLLPGSAYHLLPDGTYCKRTIIPPSWKRCMFEYNYIAHKDSVIDRTSVQSVREALGGRLAEEFPFTFLDFVTCIPRCPEQAARQYASSLNLKFIDVFYKMRSDRSFQGPDEEERKNTIKRNLGILPHIRENLEDKVVGVIDDSTIRGNNGKYAISLLRKLGVKEIHLLNYTPKIGVISSGDLYHGCKFGVDMPPDDNFIVREGERNRSIAEINEAMDVKTYFLSVEGLLETFESFGIDREDLCYHCIGGSHPFSY